MVAKRFFYAAWACVLAAVALARANERFSGALLLPGALFLLVAVRLGLWPQYDFLTNVTLLNVMATALALIWLGTRLVLLI